MTAKKTGKNPYGHHYGDQIELGQMHAEEWAVLLYRLKRFGPKIWDTRFWGPLPQEPGCAAPIELQAAGMTELERLRQRFIENTRSTY